MKKIALVAALAAVAVPAFAQSSVTLWGRLNTSVESQKVGSGDRAIKVANNSSRLGFRGLEDLGGGLKAAFNLEHGFNSDTGTFQTFGGATNMFWSRQANVELQGAFGAVRLGSWFPGSYFAVVDPTSNHNHDTGSSSDALFSDFAFSARTNKVAWFTPDVGGFTAEIAAHAGEGVAGDAKAYDLSGNYTQGPLHVGLGYSKWNVVGAAKKNYGLEADYNLGSILVTGYVQREEIGVLKRDIYGVSGMYVMGASEFHLNYGHTSSQAGKDNAAKQYTVGYNYNLSKRTKVYGFYTAVDNSKGSYGSGVAGADFSSLAAGIRHNF